ncbi:MAG: aminotransferase class V-fold PLP-dependent enzyme [Ignavibacteria bacterium]|jgi:isopenicillin-N epimerase
MKAIKTPKIPSSIKYPDFGSKEIRNLFLIDKNITFLNNGSFGATPAIVLEYQDAIRQRMESQPVNFVVQQLPVLLRESLQKIAPFLGANADDLAFVDNATTGANTVIQSLMHSWKKGDEILTTNHVYGAVRTTLQHATSIIGAKLIEAHIPFPLQDEQECVDAIIRHLNKKTKLLVIDHITSPTGIIFPIEAMIHECKKRGIPVFVDGAHAPGMIPLNLNELDADWYTGNCHKWLYAPKGCAILWTHPKHQHMMHPTVISHGYLQGYKQEFDWTGTKDHSAYICAPFGMALHNAMGSEFLMQAFHAKVIAMRNMIAEAWKTPIPSPDSMIGSLASIEAPKHLQYDGEDALLYAQALHDILWNEHKIEIPVIPFQGKIWIRISVQVFNRFKDYMHLAEVVQTIKKSEVKKMLKTLKS